MVKNSPNSSSNHKPDAEQPGDVEVQPSQPQSGLIPDDTLTKVDPACTVVQLESKLERVRNHLQGLRRMAPTGLAPAIDNAILETYVDAPKPSDMAKTAARAEEKQPQPQSKSTSMSKEHPDGV